MLKAPRLLALLALLGGVSSAEAPPAELQAPIAAVTVYSDRARVTRRSEGVPQGGGLIRIAVAGLPDGLEDDSVRVTFPGSPAARALSVEVERRFQERFTSEEARKREEAVRVIEEEGKLLAAREAALARERDVLEGLAIGAQPTPGRERLEKPVAPEAWGQVLDAVAQGLAGNGEARLEASRKRRDWDRRLAAARHALAETQSGHRRAEKAVLVEADGPVPGGAVEVSYLVGGAMWMPAYDVRVSPADAKLEIARFAVVRQRTGEDWEGAALIFSTAVPAVSGTIPELMAWTIGEAPRREADRGRPERRKSEGKGARRQLGEPEKRRPVADGAYAGVDVPDAEGTETGDETAHQQHDVRELLGELDDFQGAMVTAGGDKADAPARLHWTFPAGDVNGDPFSNVVVGQAAYSGRRWIPPCVLAGGYDYAFPALKAETVRSDGKPARIGLGTDACPAALRYEAAPLSSPHAYLTCDLKNASAAPYLAGQAHIYLSGDFLGEAPLKTIAVGGTVPVPLGIDEKVKVVRKSRDVKGAAGFFRTKERTNTIVEISATSFLKAPVTLRLIDRAPYAFQENISVEISNVSPPAAEQDKKNLLVWELGLSPGKPEAVTFTYGVRTPDDFDLSESEDAEARR